MTEWVETKTIRRGNNTVTIYKPVLTPAEQKKRERQVQDALSRVMRDYIHNKEANRNEPNRT